MGEHGFTDNFQYGDFADKILPGGVDKPAILTGYLERKQRE